MNVRKTTVNTVIGSESHTENGEHYVVNAGLLDSALGRERQFPAERLYFSGVLKRSTK